MTGQEITKYNLPDLPGVYIFKKGKTVLYVGKATSLRSRVRSYFLENIIITRGEKIRRMLSEADSVSWTVTDSVLEALILESVNIKKFSPDYNSIGKDDKSYNFIVISDEEWPSVSVARQRELEIGPLSQMPRKFIAGPFPHGAQLKEALKIVRKIFTFRDQKCVPLEIQRAKAKNKENFTPRPCFNRQIGLCPGVCTGDISKRDYNKTIKNISLFFEGKRDTVEKNLQKEMKLLVKNLEFEKAEKVKNQLFALTHIKDVSLLKRDYEREYGSEEKDHERAFRIEAYDIAHLAGSGSVGVMVVMEDNELNKNEYRKFKIRGKNGKVGIDDTGNLKEILKRRFGHKEWAFPNLIVIDGSVAQINAAKEVINELDLKVDLVSVVKDEKHKGVKILSDIDISESLKSKIFEINAEAHRFAINYNRSTLRRPFQSKKRYSQ